MPAETQEPAGQILFEGEALTWTRSGDTLEVLLHREPANEIGLTTLGELETLAAHLRDGADGAQALVIHSNQRRGFCAGADLRELYYELVAHKAEGGSMADAKGQVRAFLDRIHAVYDTIDQAPLTTIGALHGTVFGGGFELALTCDVLVADKSARFCFPELRLGLIPGWGGIPRLRRDIGNAIVRDILLTGRSLNAARAQQIGLVSQVVARGEALTVARRVAEQACRFDAVTAAKAKRFTKPHPAEELADEKALFCELFTSPVVEAALQRFVESTDAMPYLP
ncbi:MAG: enoyl-CoA hydratase/isomerase family protein [Myxococcota bacterium]